MCSMTIKEMPLEERPRERCLRKGTVVLSTAELLAVLLGSGVSGKSALEMGGELLSRHGSLRGLSRAGLREMQALEGLGPARAVRVAAALELARRLAEEEFHKPQSLAGAEEAYRFLRPRMRDLPHEVFAVIFLDQKHGVLAYRELFRGSVASSTVHPREIIIEALKENAAALILAHNHPSGHVRPSPEDMRLTQDLMDLLARLEIRVLDHLIVGGSGYFSFAREGLLNN